MIFTLPIPVQTGMVEQAPLRKAECFSRSAGEYSLIPDCCFVSHAFGHGYGDDDGYAVIALGSSG